MYGDELEPGVEEKLLPPTPTSAVVAASSVLKGQYRYK